MDTEYAQAIEAFRAERLQRLREEYGWLSLTGLWPLIPGDNELPFGTVRREGDVVRLGDRTLRANEDDFVWQGTTRYELIRREGLVAIRARDPASPTRTGFRGIACFPIDPQWRREARMDPSGRVTFTVGERVLGLTPAREGDRLFFVFADLSSGYQTYEAGRFLYTPLPGDDRVELDFNRAINPPCALTDFAVCPVVRPENRLPVAVTAGEKAPGVE